MILELDEEGSVLQNLHDPDGDHYAFVTSALERGDFIYLGSLMDDAIARLPVPMPNEN